MNNSLIEVLKKYVTKSTRLTENELVDMKTYYPYEFTRFYEHLGACEIANPVELDRGVSVPYLKIVPPNKYENVPIDYNIAVAFGEVYSPDGFIIGNLAFDLDDEIFFLIDGDSTYTNIVYQPHQNLNGLMSSLINDPESVLKNKKSIINLTKENN